MKYKVVPEEDRVATTEALRAADTPIPPTYVHPSVAHLVPETWDGSDPVPIGWSRNWSIDPWLGQWLISATDELAAEVPEMAGATDSPPEPPE